MNMVKRFHVDAMDTSYGMKSYHVVDGGQTVAVVQEDLFEDPWDAKRWAQRVCDSLNEMNHPEWTTKPVKVP